MSSTRVVSDVSTDYHEYVRKAADLLQYTVELERWLSKELHPWLGELEGRVSRLEDKAMTSKPPQPPPPPWGKRRPRRDDHRQRVQAPGR
jgi:hypothetical protein